MKNEEIISIFENNNINVDRIESINNSFSSNVYIVYSDNKKYIFKILFNKIKANDEAKYMQYLQKYIDVPQFLFSGNKSEKYFNVMTYVDGKSFIDSEIKNLTLNDAYNMGVLLAKLHSIPLIDNEKNSWYKYLNEYLEKSNYSLKTILKNNNVIYEFILSEIKNIKKDYDNVILHLDYRVGNILFGDKVYLIDFESMKNGDSCFDFLKMYRSLSKKQFNEFLKGYNSIRKSDDKLKERIEFYNIFDAYTSLNWCIERNCIDSEFYQKNYKILMKKFKL